MVEVPVDWALKEVEMADDRNRRWARREISPAGNELLQEKENKKEEQQNREKIHLICLMISMETFSCLIDIICCAFCLHVGTTPPLIYAQNPKIIAYLLIFVKNKLIKNIHKLKKYRV